jgi:hypothetical protein
VEKNLNKVCTVLLCILIGAVALTGCATSQIAKNIPESGSPNPEAPPRFPQEMPHYHVSVVVSDSQVASIQSDFPTALGTEPLAYRVTVELVNPKGRTPPFFITRIFELPASRSHEKALIDVYADAEEQGVRVYKAWRIVLANADSTIAHKASCRASVVSDVVRKPRGAEVRCVYTVDLLMESNSPALVAQPAKLHIQFAEDKEVVLPLLRK